MAAPDPSMDLRNPAKRRIDLMRPPDPWTYNPSKWSQRVTISLIAGVGFLIALYMGLYQWRLIDSVGDPIFGKGSQRVLDSELSHWMSSWMHMPDAILGALAYGGDIIFAMAGSTRRWQFRPWLVVLFGLDVIPLGIVSAILVLCQGLIVGSWCTLCLVTAAISLLLVYLAYDEVWSCLRYLWGVYRRSGSVVELWNAFWGKPSDLAHEVGMEIAR